MTRRGESGQKTRAGWCAVGCVGVGVLEDRGALRQPIDIRCLVGIPPGEADVMPTEVIDEEYEDVRPLIGRTKSHVHEGREI